MHAIVQHRYGGPEQLIPGTMETPKPGPKEVLIRVRAAGIDRGVWHLMTGTPLAVRPFIGFRAPRRPVLGGDVAGVVEAVGDAVTRWHVGDEVLGFGRSTFAEYAVAREDRLAAKPAALDWAAAAVIPVSGVTALQAARAARIQPGSRVLVLGAGGGVGTFAVQVAVHLGAVVTGVTTTAKLELVRSLGASRVIDYTVSGLDGEYDVIIDIGGLRAPSVLREVLAPKGTVVFVGGEGGGPILGGLLTRNGGAAFSTLFSGQRMLGLAATSNGEALRELVDMVAAGAVHPVVARSYPLAEAEDALRELEAGPAGKLALTLTL